MNLNESEPMSSKILTPQAAQELLAQGAVLVDIRGADEYAREHIAVAEAMKLNIPIFAMVDTNSDPRQIDYVIPSNDDASKSIESVMSFVSEAIIEGLSERKSGKDEDDNDDEGMEKASKKAPKKARVTDDVEVPSKDKEDVEAMEDAKQPVRLKSKKEVLNEEE